MDDYEVGLRNMSIEELIVECVSENKEKVFLSKEIGDKIDDFGKVYNERTCLVIENENLKKDLEDSYIAAGKAVGELEVLKAKRTISLKITDTDAFKEKLAKIKAKAEETVAAKLKEIGASEGAGRARVWQAKADLEELNLHHQKQANVINGSFSMGFGLYGDVIINDFPIPEKLCERLFKHLSEKHGDKQTDCDKCIQKRHHDEILEFFQRKANERHASRL